MNENITVLKDESLGGIEREYREVKRKADVGERIKVTYANHEWKGGPVTVDFIDHEGDPSWKAEDSNSTYYVKPDWFVVLEPTDIIRIGNERLRMVDRKAAVGERVVVVNPDKNAFIHGGYKTGDIAEITSTDSDSQGTYYLAKRSDGKGIALYAREYHVLEPAKSAAPLSAQPPLDQAAANISALTAKVRALESRVATLEMASKAVKVAEGPADDAPPSFAIPRRSGKTFPSPAIAPPKPPQQIRDEIVERAKDDVKRLERLYGIKFVVNRDKRTVVALQVDFDKDRVVDRAIAKCAPDDVFNSHIGKAIAARRLLWFDIPAEYMNVPNPEEPRVGDVVFCHGLGDVFSLTGTLTERAAEFDGSAYGNNAFYWSLGGWIANNQYRVIDDSREEVGA